jgi:tetratricopeptide (TPR) repeat protein
MDLSFLKWPIILGVIALIAWLGSSGGVNYMYKKFTADPPGVDAKKDEINEAGLSRLGGYCLRLTKYQKALAIFEEAANRFPGGKNFWYNRYRMVRCAEKMKDFKRAVDLMHELIAADASKIDDRVADNDNLRLRSEKLIEMYELEKR